MNRKDHIAGIQDQRKKRKNIRTSKATIERKTFEKDLNKNFKIWITGNDPKKEYNYFIVEIKTVRHLNYAELEAILDERLSDLFE